MHQYILKKYYKTTDKVTKAQTKRLDILMRERFQQQQQQQQQQRNEQDEELLAILNNERNARTKEYIAHMKKNKK